VALNEQTIETGMKFAWSWKNAEENCMVPGKWRMEMNRSGFFIMVLVFGWSASLRAADYQIKENIPYRDAATIASDGYAKEMCVLDIYQPKATKRLPVVIWFHGGGLTSGSKYLPGELRDQELCIVAPNYRLSPKVKAATCIEDAAAAVAWVFKNISKYGGDPDKIFISGHSAGGYLTLMVGMDKKWLQAYGIDANQIAGLIPFSGHTITHFTVRKELGIADTQPIIDEYAPLYYVRADAPPLLLITGDRELELLGRYEENAYMMRMMKIAGHQDTRIMELDGYNHGMERPAYPLLVNEVQRVLKANAE
jgi:acetyl esterase/lipase